MSSTTPGPTPATPPRIDPCAAVHKALRHALTAQLQQLGTLDAQDAAQVAATLGQLTSLLDRLATHQRLETEFLHAALAARQPGLIGTAVQDHRDDLTRLAALRGLAEELAAGTDAAQRRALLDRLYRETTAFITLQLRHMAHEEQALMPACRALFSEAQLQLLQRRALASVPRWERQAWALLMADALNPDELAAMLLAQRDDGAPEAWLALAMAVQGRAGATRWAAVAERLRDAGAL